MTPAEKIAARAIEGGYVDEFVEAYASSPTWSAAEVDTLAKVSEKLSALVGESVSARRRRGLIGLDSLHDVFIDRCSEVSKNDVR